MVITSAQYYRSNMTGENSCINAVINGDTVSIPLDPDNRHYAEILKQVEAGTLTIQEAD